MIRRLWRGVTRKGGSPPRPRVPVRDRIRATVGRIRATGIRGVIAVVAAVLVAGFIAGGVAQTGIETGVNSFLPSNDPSMRQLESLGDSFGGDPIVVLLETPQPRALLAQDQLERMLALESTLSQLPDVAALYGPVTSLNELAGQAQKVIAELVGRRDGLAQRARTDAQKRGASPQEADAAAKDATAQFDTRYGPILVDALPVGLPTLRNPKLVDNVVFGSDGEPRPRWQYVVPNQTSLAILVRPRAGLAQTGTEDLVSRVEQTVRSAGLPPDTKITVSGVSSIVAALGRSITTQIPVIGAVAVVAIGLVLFLVPWTERRRRLLPLAVTVLATGLTVATLGWIGRPLSLGVLAFLPVLVGIGSYYPTYFAQRARSRVVFVVAAATALSFATLTLTPLAFVRDLGITMALGVVFSVGLSALLVRRASGEAGPARPAPASPAPRALPSSTPRRTRVAVGAAVGVVAVAGWVALAWLPLQTNIQDLAQGLPTLQDANHVRGVVGSDGELDVVLSDDGDPATPPVDVRNPQAWSWMQQVAQQIVVAHGDQLTPVLSPPGLLDFLGPNPTGDQIAAGLRLMPDFLTSAVLRPDGRVATMSYGVSLNDIEALNRITRDLPSQIPPPPPGLKVELAGLPTVATRGYQLVSSDRYLASLAGVVAAGAVLLVGLRRRVDAVRAMAAASIAAGVEFAFLWATQLALNPLTVALGSLTAAVGCEFTAMVSQSARLGDRSLLRAVALAAATSATGYAVLALSPLALMRQFGLLLALSVLLAYAAALFVVWVWPPTGSDTAEPPFRPRLPRLRRPAGPASDVPAPRDVTSVSSSHSGVS